MRGGDEDRVAGCPGFLLDAEEVLCCCIPLEVNISDREGFLEEIREIGDATGTNVVCLDADRIAGRRHVEAAVRHAFRARREGRMVARRVEMEALCYAAGTRQTGIAAGFGVREGLMHLYCCICPPEPEAVRRITAGYPPSDLDYDEITPEKARRLMDFFDITPAELEAAGGPERLRDLVIERTVLLEVYK
ncbi:MAG: KEOPS complex subunit Cgi121 [Methanoculleaceae archaeon]